MSENIVKFGGDTTVRQLWDGGPTGNTGVSRLLNPGNRNFTMVMYQQAKPILDSEMNLHQLIQNKLRADLIRSIISTGFLSMDITAGVTDKKNCLRISNALANVNGWLLFLNGQNRTDSKSDIIFPAAPNNGTREDLAFLEVWFEEVAPTGSPEDDDENVFNYGGVNSGTLGNDLQDPVAGDETSRRIQLRWNLRTVPDVNFASYPDGVGNSDKVKARGGNDTDTDYSFSKISDGLYRAGSGTSSDCSILKCTDGFVYAIPLFKVHRRNQIAFDAKSNPGGAPVYGSGVTIASGLYHDVIDNSDVTPIFPVSAPYSGGNLNALGAALADAETLGHVNWAELEKWKKQRIQQGLVTIYNRFVVSGCIVGAVPGTRNIQITATGAFDKKNQSKYFADGLLRAFGDVQSSVASVPINGSSEAKTYYAFLQKNGDAFEPHVDSEVPEDAIRLYRITVPSGDTAANLDKVSFADERRLEPNYSAYYNSLPFAMVVLPGFTMPDYPDYSVHLEVESAVGGIDSVGLLRVVEKSNNGFKITANGTADNVVVRWTLINPDA